MNSVELNLNFHIFKVSTILTVLSPKSNIRNYYKWISFSYLWYDISNIQYLYVTFKNKKVLGVKLMLIGASKRKENSCHRLQEIEIDQPILESGWEAMFTKMSSEQRST